MDDDGVGGHGVEDVFAFGGNQARNTWSVTGYIGRRLWEGAELYINPEFAQGFGMTEAGVNCFTMDIDDADLKPESVRQQLARKMGAGQGPGSPAQSDGALLADAQRSGLDALTDATRKAADFLKAHCPTDPTLTPPGRVTAMEQRLKAMLEAINIVQPALENFYGSLTDEQKARFNLLGSQQG